MWVQIVYVLSLFLTLLGLFAEARAQSRQVVVSKPVVVARPVTIGQPTQVGRPVPIGQPVIVGRPVTVGTPVQLARPIAVGRPATSGYAVPVARPVPIGTPAVVGRPSVVGSPVQTNTPRIIGSTTAIGRPTNIGAPTALGVARSIGGGKAVGTPTQSNQGASQNPYSRAINATASAAVGSQAPSSSASSQSSSANPFASVLKPTQKNGQTSTTASVPLSALPQLGVTSESSAKSATSSSLKFQNALPPVGSSGIAGTTPATVGRPSVEKGTDSPAATFNRTVFPSQLASLNVNTNAKTALEMLGASGRINLIGASSTNGYIYPSTLASRPAIDQEQCVQLVRGVTNLGPASNWQESSTKISPYLGGSHPDIPAGTPIATFENKTYPAATGTMSTPRLDGVTSNKSSHAAVFLDYVKDSQGNRVGIKILSQSENKPANVEEKYFIGANGGNHVGYSYSVIEQ